jgi:hypothetical protein
MLTNIPFLFWVGILGLSMVAFSTTMSLRVRGVFILINLFTIISAVSPIVSNC